MLKIWREDGWYYASNGITTLCYGSNLNELMKYAFIDLLEYYE